MAQAVGERREPPAELFDGLRLGGLAFADQRSLCLDEVTLGRLELIRTSHPRLLGGISRSFEEGVVLVGPAQHQREGKNDTADYEDDGQEYEDDDQELYVSASL